MRLAASSHATLRGVASQGGGVSQHGGGWGVLYNNNDADVTPYIKADST